MKGSWSAFEQDDDQKRSNLAEHGLRYEDAEAVFSRPCVTNEDARRKCGEQRFITLGQLDGRTVVIAHTPRGENTRIISLRKANSREQENYQERLEASRRDEG